MEVKAKELAMGIEIEKEHAKSITGDKETKRRKIKAIAKDHLDELPDYYSRLKKMEKDGKRAQTMKRESNTKMEEVGSGTTSNNPDVLELLHRANAARIRQGAKEGKFWLIRSEDVMDRKELIKRIIETTMTSNIGTFNVGFGGGGDFKPNEPAFGGRNKFTKKQLRFAVQGLLSRKSMAHPKV